MSTPIDPDVAEWLVGGRIRPKRPVTEAYCHVCGIVITPENLGAAEPNEGYPLFFCTRILCISGGEWPNSTKPIIFRLWKPHPRIDEASGAPIQRLRGKVFRRRATAAEARTTRPTRSIARRHRRASRDLVNNP